jgi:hypothetical protein
MVESRPHSENWSPCIPHCPTNRSVDQALVLVRGGLNWRLWAKPPVVFVIFTASACHPAPDFIPHRMRDTFKIYQGIHDNQVRAGENAAAGWSQVIRGVTSIEDVVTKRRGDVDTRSVDDVLKVLNRDGDNYRQVPMNELVR